MATNGPSSIALAFAGKTASVDIPKPRDSNHFVGRDTFAAVTARSLPSKSRSDNNNNDSNNNNLLTPPNSISPSLPPHGFKRKGRHAPDAPPSPAHFDSDIDLRDTAHQSDGRDQDHQPQHSFPATAEGPDPMVLDAAGAITPGLLAKHHLPEILLAHGPLAIRYVMGYLTTSVPGFSGIPPAKARRLVVGALEGRGSGGEGGGINGDVEFEKVGWGRWDARMKGQPPRESRGMRRGSLAGGNLSPPASMPSSSYYSNLSTGAVPISNSARWPDVSNNARLGTSWTGDSAVFSHDEDVDPTDREDITMLEHEADKMSLDGNESCSSSEAAPEATSLPDEDVGDATDDEDWANIGAAALRQASVSTSARQRRHAYQSYRSLYNNKLLYSLDRGGVRSTSTQPVQPSAPSNHLCNNTYPSPNTVQHISSDSPGFSFGHHPIGYGTASDSQQEREAIEALLRLSSV
ncbi:MAG: DNA-binding proteins Bright/BRCAA1/RBP1 and proteins containing BRIGHT domain [Sclerophora amabilis]|nr:MAG: DNA-binding proteins Bright/BRCAA1/RBP1 and proteins containing BRIGHT domain [Sclerophora amabilis]